MLFSEPRLSGTLMASESEPFYELFLLDKLNIAKIKVVKTGT